MTNTTVVNHKVNSATISSIQSLQKKQNRLGPYKLLQTLGEGEFGKVKLGVHAETGQEVAIKLIKKDGDGSDSRLNKVEREISVLKVLQHPNIVKLYNVVETEKYIGIILEYASGGELFEYILAHRFLKEKDSKRFFAQLISSVQYMHERNIVHRDLKLENLLLDKHRNIIVTDFGFANQFDSATDDLMATTCGSPCYAAPELVVNAGLYAGSAVDIWSCGVILYAMLCGFLPFDDDPSNPDSDNINQLYKYIMSTNLMFPSHVSDGARDLLLKMLVPDPTKRCSLDYITGHPWLKEYRSLFKISTPPDNNNIGVEQKKINVKKESPIPVNNSVSTTLPRQHNKSGTTDFSSRKTHIPTVARDRFAPVANEKYFTSKKREAEKEQKLTETSSKNSFVNFAISQPSATTTTTESPVLATPLFPSMRSSKTPTLITRKPIKDDTIVTNGDSKEVSAINPEKSLSSPVSINENKVFNLSTFGNIYKNQRQGTDKFFGFFSTAKVSQNTTNTTNEDLMSESTVDQAESLQESANEREYTTTDNESSVYQEKKYVIHSISDVSTMGVSAPSLCLSEDMNSSPTTPVPKQFRKSTDRTNEKQLKILTGPTNQEFGRSKDEPHHFEPEDNTPSITSPKAKDKSSVCTDSIISENGTSSIRSSLVSFKDTPRHTTIFHSSKDESQSSLPIRHHYTQTQHNDSRTSIKSTSTNGNQDAKAQIQPEVTSSTRLTTKTVSNAVGDSGRKAFAAVRKSIYRKHKNQAHVENQSQNVNEATERNGSTPNKREPLISFSKSRFEEPGKQIQSKRDRQSNNNQRHTWGNSNVMASISEVPGKAGVSNETASKRTGNKMMDWIKKRSQGKESKKESASTQRTVTNRVNSPVIKLSTSKRTSNTKNEKEPPKVIQKSSNDIETPKKKEADRSEDRKPSYENEVIEVPECNNIRTRKRANSGNSAALKELVTREKHPSREQMQIHQGAIDRSALTSQSPETVIKEAARILRILGIETKLESEFVLKCHRRKAKSLISADLLKKQELEESEMSSSNQQLEPIYGDASIDNGDEIRFAVEICRFKHLPGLYIVDVRRLKGNAWAYKFLYHKLIDFLNFDKDGYILSPAQ